MIDFSTELGRKAKRYLEEEYVIWFTTVGADLTPQPRPVWFIWEGSSFLIFSRPDAHKVTHVQGHPNVALHFNTDATGDQDVIVFLGGRKSFRTRCPRTNSRLISKNIGRAWQT